MPKQNNKQLTFNRLMREYYDSPVRAHERLGQWFVNRYIEGQWGDLFFEENDYKAVEKIHQWLLDNGFEYRMPKLIHK